MWFALAGAALGMMANNEDTKNKFKGVAEQIGIESEYLLMNSRQAYQNSVQLDNELGDILSANALETAKAMATSNAIMSASGTVGGTNKLVSRQAMMNQILTDADTIAQARNQKIDILNKNIGERIDFRMRSNAMIAGLPSATSQMLSGINAGIKGASMGMSLAQQTKGAFGPPSCDGIKDPSAKAACEQNRKTHWTTKI